MPSLDEQTLDDWWKYAQRGQRRAGKPDENHDFFAVSVILAAGETDKSVLKKLKKLSDERKYQSGKHGWSSIRLAVVDLDTHKVHTNRMGDSLKKHSPAACLGQISDENTENLLKKSTFNMI